MMERGCTDTAAWSRGPDGRAFTKYELLQNLEGTVWLGHPQIDTLLFHFCKLSHCMFGPSLAHFASRRVMFMETGFHKFLERGDATGVMKATNHFNLFVDM